MSKVEEANRRHDPVFLKELARPGKALEVIYELMTEGWLNGTRITSIIVRGPSAERDGLMAIIKAEDALRKPLVAFRTAGTPKELVLKILSDVENDRLAFKEEQPYDPAGKLAAKTAAQKKG
jgi:hypothetical protein